MSSKAFVNGEVFGDVVAITTSIRRQVGEGKAGIFGQVVILDVNYDVLEKHQPRNSLLPHPLSLQLEITHPSKGCQIVYLTNTLLVEEGWGWSEDDLTNETAFAYWAQSIKVI